MAMKERLYSFLLNCYTVPGGHGPAHCMPHWHWVKSDSGPWGVESALPETQR